MPVRVRVLCLTYLRDLLLVVAGGTCLKIVPCSGMMFVWHGYAASIETLLLYYNVFLEAANVFLEL